MRVDTSTMKTFARELPITPVRSSVHAFIPHLQHVHIQEDRLDEFADNIAKDEFELPAWRAPVFLDESESGVSASDVVDFLFVGNSINFQFRDYETGEKFGAQYDGIEWGGAFGMWASLKRAYENGDNILEGTVLASLTTTDLKRIFNSSNGIGMPMLEDRQEILNSVGQTLSEKYNGRFSNFIEKKSNRLYDDGNGIVEQLIQEFPSYDDTSEIPVRGETHSIHLYKRAQLVPGMMYGRFSNSVFYPIDDPQSFTVFADYNLPNILNYNGILRYDETLQKLIQAGELIPQNSRMETELRVATIYASDEIIARVNQQRKSPINGAHMDYHLFNMRDDVRTPVHLTRTTAY